MNQTSLWHDSPEEALRALIDALGGPKRVGSEMFPDKSMDDAKRLLMHWCSPERAEKPSLTQLLFLIRKGRQAGAHVFAAYLASECGYRVEPIEPRDEYAEMQRDYISAVEKLEAITKQLQRVQLRVAG